MTNHPSRSKYRYLKVSQGYANTVIYLRVPLDQVDAANAHFKDYEDGNPTGHLTGRWVSWTDDKHARIPGVAVDWADRAYVRL